VIVRPVAPSDAAFWARMRRALWPGDEHPDEVAKFFRGELDEPSFVLVALDGEQFLGFAELSVHEPGHLAYLEGWWVDPAWRRRGVGRALVAAAEAWGRAQGCREFGSDTEVSNTASAAAHAALGFTEVEQLRCFRKPL
jgi:aminoglycoside 6'-N-acetyltransferase I